jgi:hypothetical protein
VTAVTLLLADRGVPWTLPAMLDFRVRILNEGWMWAPQLKLQL